MTIVREGGRGPLPLICRDRQSPTRPDAVTAIGNFDGVHLGHRHLIEVARREARVDGRPTAALTFEPHPRDFFRPDTPSFRLTPEPVKLKVMGALGIDIAFVRTFDGEFAGTGAAGFVSNILRQELRVSEVVVGTNFHFGRRREGTPDILVELARQNGMTARIEGPVSLDGAPVSSSRIRTMLEDGDVGGANRLLGYRWFVEGAVQHGEKRGRTLGYPTANLRLEDGCRLRHGIYAVRVAVAPGEVRDGVASFGRRPTFDNGAPLLETFLFDFDADLYGRHIEVELVGWIRGEERFGSAEDLVAAMDRDSEQARAHLARSGNDGSLIG